MDVVALFQYGVDAGGRHAGHRDHAGPRRTAVPQRRRRVLLLRRRPRRPQRRVEGAGIGAAAHEATAARRSSCSCPTARTRTASCARKARTAFDARLRDATPLSEFFFDDAVASDVNLSSLDGKARLAERAQAAARADPRRRVRRPDAAAPDRTHRRRRARRRRRRRRPRRAHAACRAARRRRSPAWCAARSPSAASAVARRWTSQPPYRFAALRQPGIELLSELVLLVRERPEITTGALLEHFDDRDEAGRPAEARLAGTARRATRPARRIPRCDHPARRCRSLQQRVDELQPAAAQRRTGRCRKAAKCAN